MSTDGTAMAARLCMALMRADTEQEVVSLLSAAGYWDDFGAWRPINDEENNFSTIGNQQSEAVAAFVEKIINGVDSRLLDGCLRAGDDPQGVSAPKSMREAVARYFERRANPSRSDGRISDWSDSEVTAQGRLLTVAATGNMPADGHPSLTVADQGEGQTPMRCQQRSCPCRRATSCGSHSCRASSTWEAPGPCSSAPGRTNFS